MEIASATPGVVPVRDSKAPEGPVLTFDRASWATAVQWIKSSHSGDDGGDCLEISPSHPHLVPVRDSKAAPHGPVLAFDRAAWASFVGAVQRGGFAV